MKLSIERDQQSKASGGVSALLSNLSDALVMVVGDIEVPCGVNRNTPRRAQQRRGCHVSVTSVTSAQVEVSRHGADVAACVDFSNDAVELICDIDVAGGINSDTRRLVKQG